jgi:hypothetical protein
MSFINFKEISSAKDATGEQEEFELFARAFLERLGYKTVANPGRGNDGGKDLIVEEHRTGPGGQRSFGGW